jgi:hypothetical protein
VLYTVCDAQGPCQVPLTPDVRPPLARFGDAGGLWSS